MTATTSIGFGLLVRIKKKEAITSITILLEEHKFYVGILSFLLSLK